jgi:hypothetical protein
MEWYRAKALLLVTAILVSVIISYFAVSSLTSQNSFDYRLNVSPINETIMQGQTLMSNITVSYLQGQPQPVTLAVAGNSSIMELNLSNTIGIPKPNQPFTSNLTIHFLANTQSAKYPVTFTSSSGTKIHSETYNLTVVNSQIQVSGTVSTPSSTNSIFPTKLQFVNLQTNITYNATLQYPNLPKASTLQQQAIYNVSLPNQQSYRVTGTWGRLYGPWSSSSDLPEGTFDCGILQVNCKVGESIINKDYYK